MNLTIKYTAEQNTASQINEITISPNLINGSPARFVNTVKTHIIVKKIQQKK